MTSAVLVIVPPIILGGFSSTTPRKGMGVSSPAVGGASGGGSLFGVEVKCTKAAAAPIQQGETTTQVWSG